jgi:phosphotransferase system HPr (HPr) family protein
MALLRDKQTYRELGSMAGNGSPKRKVEIHFPVGLHVRPATIIAQKARRFQAEIFLVYQERRVSARNVFDMFLLGAEKGAVVTLEADGSEDAEQALDAVAALFAPDCPEMKWPEE